MCPPRGGSKFILLTLMILPDLLDSVRPGLFSLWFYRYRNGVNLKLSKITKIINSFIQYVDLKAKRNLKILLIIKNPYLLNKARKKMENMGRSSDKSQTIRLIQTQTEEFF